jgi:hypothetical protein
MGNMLSREDFEQQVVNYFTQVGAHAKPLPVTPIREQRTTGCSFEVNIVGYSTPESRFSNGPPDFEVIYWVRPDGYESWEIVCRLDEALRFPASRGQTLEQAHEALVERAEAVAERAELAALEAARVVNQLRLPR